MVRQTPRTDGHDGDDFIGCDDYDDEQNPQRVEEKNTW